MNRSPRQNAPSRRNERKVNTRLDIETLDSRVMMSATPPSELAAAPTAMVLSTLEGADVLALAPNAGSGMSTPKAEPDPQPWIDSSAIAETMPGIGPSDAGYPAPDDDGDWGPIGPVVQEGLQRVADIFAEQMVLAETMPGIGPSDAGYPAPDDDGDWGPVGPVVQEGLQRVADIFADQLGEQMQVVAMPGGSAGQPSPDDDTVWPPGIGPLIKTDDAADSDPERIEVVPDVTLVRRMPGDANHDGLFNSSDLVQVFAAGKFDDGIPGNATFEEGDWNYDGDFATDDLVLALALGHYGVEREEAGEIDPASLERERVIILP